MINSFRGKYRFLSNFWMLDSPILWENIPYSSVEHAYQAAKTLNLNERWLISRAYSAGEAKRRGRKLELRPDWEEIKLSIMEVLVRLKFSNSQLLTMLLSTYPDCLIEGNTWHDNFWGICYCHNCKYVDHFTEEGQNHLGKILLKVRGEFRSNYASPKTS